jgi:cysteine desulfurase
MAHSSLRFGLGRFTTEAEVDFVTQKLVSVVQKLRDMRQGYLTLFFVKCLLDYSPLWEMVQEGIDINTIDWAQH